ncbi:MAG TPA: glycoside hydrolase family 57 protein [Candidatus Polarisedimenticolaceae bacterium]|nr:glycoside hydrolase family 57 protein [Candidatus Polarisedimenticolaceae bacterium]
MSDARAPLQLALVWHMHQPDYVDPTSGERFMPWTRLHALKDYADMAEHLARHPGVRATFNVVPALLTELIAYGDGTARPDAFLALSRRRVDTLRADDRAYVVGRFFALNRPTMAKGLPRLNELAALRGDYPIDGVPSQVLSRFDDQAILDLTVLFHLAWSGPLLSADPQVKALRGKGRNYSEEDKHTLLDLQDTFLAGVLPRWQALARAGHVEFSVSPYYHPILPLLCDLESAHEALPEMRLPAASFKHAADADWHLREARRSFAEVFGQEPAGGWPSEGAISEASLRRMGASGWAWSASDEEVLFGSLGEGRRPALLHRPWRFGSGPALLFRDHDLSDRIGFVYSGWHAEPAAQDFLGKLHQIAQALPREDGPYTVSVILDGENAWEYYPDHGAPFLDALYGALERDTSVRTVTASEAVAGPVRALPRVVAGSWIGHSLATWVGHPDKNLAWERLAAARDAVERARGAPDGSDPAWRAIFAAEGSDWFWWFGDDHPTAFAGEFDATFRRHLRAAYVAAGLAAPQVLSEPIRRHARRVFEPPTGRIAPRLDGEVSDYFEWLSAGQAHAGYGAMESASRLVRLLLFGTDGTRLYLRLDPTEPPAAESLAGAILVVRLFGAEERILRAPLRGGGRTVAGPLEVVVGRIVEAALPLSPADGPEARFQVEIDGGAGSSQRLPAEGSLAVAWGEDPALYDWSV